MKQKIKQLREFLSTKFGKQVVLVTLLVLVIGGVIIAMVLSRPKPTPDIESEEFDPVSGQSIRHIDQEPQEAHDMVNVVGFIIFSRVGFTAQQQDAIFTTVQSFFTEKYPSMQRISYQQNSISYDANNEDITWFEVVSDTGETFRIKIDTEGSILNAKLSIYNSTGILLN
jgi:hypothetical protein